MCAFVPALQQIISGNADDPTRDMSNWNSIVNVVNGQLDDTNIAAGANIAISKTALGTYTAWTDWTPTVTLTGSLTKSSSAINKARYCQIGKTILFYCDIGVVFSGGTGSAVRFSLPVTASFANFGGGYMFYDGGNKSGWFYTTNTTSIDCGRFDGANLTIISSEFFINGSYEAA